MEEMKNQESGERYKDDTCNMCGGSGTVDDKGTICPDCKGTGVVMA
ncbi:hypothetical protein EI42_04316 [Thermosporothrix hazakensis]|uniref:Chaperone protein DnaJ n=2 Tax=Thermosporothrix TaxID=768650 RepID=A0A326U1S9_THEHA|nr:hypothetical protein EI42_04316 [Thermosporothrix hazakensis]BBH88051.1 hypothetical protein KTC_28020 [Thermosporothrix sp. COM3]GCE50497.1 hypothetical protein KTH_53660 [Thermosporothrix hazakensis]